jgi:hypothetical protein
VGTHKHVRTHTHTHAHTPHHPEQFFLEPVWLSVNYAKSLGYQRIIMGGLSGGGWTTTVAAAIDPRIGLSFPVAGSVPCDFRHT